MIELGSRVRDFITGFEGVVTARTDWLNGCRRYAVQSAELKEGKPREAEWFDENQLENLEPAVRRVGPVTGGPRPVEAG